jgi:hypothetical protein
MSRRTRLAFAGARQDSIPAANDFYDFDLHQSQPSPNEILAGLSPIAGAEQNERRELSLQRLFANG